MTADQASLHLELQERGQGVTWGQRGFLQWRVSSASRVKGGVCPGPEETQRGAEGRCLGERDWLWGGHFDLRAGKKAEAEGLAAQAAACGQSPEIAVWVELCRDSGTTGLVRHVSQIARDLSAQAV